MSKPVGFDDLKYQDLLLYKILDPGGTWSASFPRISPRIWFDRIYVISSR